MAQSHTREVYADGSIVYSNLFNDIGVPLLGSRKSIEARVITHYWDGTPMTDDKVDNKLYSKIGAEYIEYLFPFWGENFLEKDTMAQMRAMEPWEIILLRRGYWKGVRLNGYYTKNDTPKPIEYILSTTSSVDDGGSVISINDIKLEYDFNGYVDARYFGLVCDYNYADNNNYTNNLPRVNDLVNYLYNLNKDVAGSQRVNPKLYFGKSGKFDGYAFDGNIDFKSGYDIICDAPLVKTDTSIGDGYFIKYGESSRTERISNRNCKSKFWAIAKNLMWTGTENFSGVQLHNFVRSEFEFVSVRKFEIGVMIYGNNSAFSYSKVKFNELLNNRIQNFIYSWSPSNAVANGYVTSCEFDYAGMGYDSTVPKDNYDKYGIVIDNLGYITESNTFRNGVTEYYKSPSKIGLPVWIRNGAMNNFYDFRHEANDNAFMRIDEGYSNFASLTITSGGELNYPNNPNWDLSMLIDDRTAHKVGGYVTTRQAETKITGFESNLVYSTGYLPSKVVSYDVDKINIQGLGGIENVSGTEFRYISDYVQGANTTQATITADGYVQIPVNRGVFFELDTSYMKSFILDVNEDKLRKGYFYFRAFDVDGNSLPWSGNIFAPLRSSSEFGANTAREFESPYVNTRNKLYTVSSLVHKVRVIYGATLANPTLPDAIYSKLKSINVYGLYGKWSSGNVSKFNNDYNYAKIRPNRLQVYKGQIVINDDLVSNPNAWGWQYTEDGVAETTKWRVLYNGQQATSVLLGGVKQAVAQANISQADLVAIATADGSDAATTQALTNAIKAWINTNLVPLVNATKASQNIELTNQRTAGQQAP